MDWLKLPKKVYFKPGSKSVALKELTEIYGFQRAFIITDSSLYKGGGAASVVDFLRERGVRTAEFFSFGKSPSIAEVKSALPKITEFNPDVIVALGDGPVMNIAKAIWFCFENPDIDLADAVKKYNTLANSVPSMGSKAKLVAIALSDAAEEFTPFVVLDDGGKTCVLAGYEFLPELAIVDSQFAEVSSKEDIAAAGKAVTESTNAVLSDNEVSEYVKGFASEAAALVKKRLADAEAGCANARYDVLNATALAGIAWANAKEAPYNKK